MCKDKSDCCCHAGTGLIQLEILRILYENPTHGYQIMENLKKFTSNEYVPESGAIYTMLRRLERRGLLTSRWERKSSRADRRIYTITEGGKTFLKEGLQLVRKRRLLMDDLIRFFDDNFAERNAKQPRRS